MKLSIIIPVYNVEDTINRCVESVLHQGIDNFEIILVDDGSTDSSRELCDKWQASNKHIIAIHQPNKGLSAARNTGISHATGDMITFVDSDDYLKDNTYSTILSLAQKHDIVEFPISRIYPSSQQAETLALEEKVFTDMQSYWTQTKAYTHTYACNKIYKRHLFKQIHFPEGKIFEDALTFPKLLQEARDICTTVHGEYYYTFNPNGITATAKGTELEMLLKGHIDSLAIWDDALFYLYVLNIQMDVTELTGKPPILPYRTVSPFTKGLTAKLRMKALLLNIFGINGICNINQAIHKWKIPRS